MITKIFSKFLQFFGFEIIKKHRSKELQLYHELFPKESITNKRFYNIGAGTFNHPYWTNVDVYSEWYSNMLKNRKFLNYDLFSLEKLPIPDNSAEIVYSSHTIEHVNDEAAQNLFNEAYRVLRTGGIFRFSTPNIDLEYRAYKKNDRHFFEWIDVYSRPINYNRLKIKIPMRNASTAQIFLHHFASYVSELFIDDSIPKISDKELEEIFQNNSYKDALNYILSKCSLEKLPKLYYGNHMNWWNEKKASEMLDKAGFKKIYRSGYGQSFSPVLRDTSLFDNTHLKVSLYMEAIK